MSLEQVKQWGISSVLRIRTDDADAYFKTTSEGMPLFVNEGAKIRVDTRSGEYVERVN